MFNTGISYSDGDDAQMTGFNENITVGYEYNDQV